MFELLSFYLTLIENEADLCKFEMLYKTYQKRMWYVANSILNDSYYAEDAIHNVFFRIASHMELLNDVKFDGVQNYLITCVKNECFDMRKRKNKFREPCEDIEEFEWTLCDNEYSLEDSVINRYTAESIVKAVHLLNSTYRDVFYLRYFMNLSVKDTAEKLGRNICTVRQQIMRGKKAIIKTLNEQGVIDDDYCQ